MCEFLEYDGGDYRSCRANGGADDLATLWKRAAAAARCRPRTQGPARAQLREPAAPSPRAT